MNYQNILENIYLDIRPYEKMGRQADYIPALAAVNPDQFGICIHTLRNDIYALGQADTRFSVQTATTYGSGWAKSLRERPSTRSYSWR